MTFLPALKIIQAIAEPRVSIRFFMVLNHQFPNTTLLLRPS